MMRNDKDFDIWFLLRLAEFVLRCRGVDFKWRNDPPVLKDKAYELVKIDRASARTLTINNARSVSIFDGGGTHPERGRTTHVCERTRAAGVE